MNSNKLELILMTWSENERTLTSHQQPPYISRLFFHFSCFLLQGEQSKAKQNKTKTNNTKTVPLGELYYPSSQSSSVDSLVIYSLLEDAIIASSPSSPLLLCLHCHSLCYLHGCSANTTSLITSSSTISE